MWIGRGTLIYGSSFLLHAGVALAVVRIEKPVEREATRISISEIKKQKPAKAEPPPPPPPPPPLVQQARKAARKAPAPPPPEAAAPVPAPAAASAQPASFGLTLSGGVGMGAGGIAVPLGNSLKAPLQPTRKAAPKALVAKAAEEKPSDGCLEQLVKPKPIAVPQPVYADRAREAGIQGKVRVELTVDETGQVVEAKVLESLGYGLDEAALEAARASRFEPATRCGKAARTTFVIGIRFAL
jgi:periplasmic protein TonB